ncbi:MAG: Asp-tRNA(Asn)/Glu-tRNA(Gln) amidotransferase subunit GatA [Pseudomonadota bacterium]|nr:Asp-tRNA(Asn)/Glu-tRNA(Gln) amidotransferase subunit GatA [Pseudomonadota bacterium]
MAIQTIKKTSELLAQKKISSEELTRFYMQRLAKHNPTINACISVVDNIERAKSLDAMREKNSSGSLSPLHGIPIIHKDNLCTKDILTTCASKALSTFKPPYDATLVSNLNKAGMVIIGKANMDEFAMGGSNENSYFGPCLNPWNKGYVPGGSSGGSAAAVAARLAPAAIGSDTGGSIRQPASYCGITGMKPSYGLVSRYGMVAFASSLDQAGPMAQTAEDCAMLLDHMASYDPENDMTSLDANDYQFSQNLKEPIRSLKVGIPKEYFHGDHIPGMQTLMQHCIDEYVALGVEIVEVSLPDVSHCVSAYYTLAPCQASSNLSRYDGNIYGYRSQLNRQQDIDDFYIQNRSESLGREVKRRIMIGTYALSSGYYDDYYVKANKISNLIRHDFHEAFRHVDVILAPTAPSHAFKIGEMIDDPVKMYQQDIYTIPVNLAELPSISFPIGFYNNLPVGMQAIGPKLSDARLLNFAHKYQEITQWHKQIPTEFDQDV